MIIDSLSILGMALETAAYTTPERIFFCTVHLMRTIQQRQEIAYHSRFGVLLPQYMIIERTFVIIGNLHIARPAEKVTGQFQHIIGTASLARIAVQKFRELLRVEEVFFLTAASRSKCMMINHRMPEEIAQLTALLILRQFIVTRLRNYFRDKCIGMFGTQIIILFLQRVYHIVMIEVLRQPLVTFVPGNGIQIIERFVDAAKLVTYHLPACLFAQRFQFIVGPIAHFRHNSQCLHIVCIQVLVYQT